MMCFDPISYDKAEKARKHSENVQEQLNQVKNDFIQHKLDYIEYLESELGEEHIIRSLPNGTRDEIRASEGKLIKRVGCEVLDRNLNWRYERSDAETYRFLIDGWLPQNNALPVSSKEIRVTENNGDTPYEISNNAGADSRLISLHGNNNLYVRVEKTKLNAMGALSNVDKLKAYLNLYPITLTYQLAEPILIPLPEQMTPNTKEIVRLSELYGMSYVKKRPLLSITFDDGYVSQYEKALPILEKYGLRCTIFVVNSSIDVGDGLTTEMIKNIVDLGHEIGSHTMTHARLDDSFTDDDAIIEELKQSKLGLQEITGQPVVSFAYPFGQSSEKSRKYVNSFFKAGRAYHASNQFVKSPYTHDNLDCVQDFGSTPLFAIGCKAVESQSIETFKTMIDSFVSLEKPGYLCIAFHQIYADDNPNTPSDRKTVSEFDEMMEHISTYVQQGLLDVLPFGEAMERMN